MEFRLELSLKSRIMESSDLPLICEDVSIIGSRLAYLLEHCCDSSTSSWQLVFDSNCLQIYEGNLDILNETDRHIPRQVGILSNMDHMPDIPCLRSHACTILHSPIKFASTYYGLLSTEIPDQVFEFIWLFNTQVQLIYG